MAHGLAKVALAHDLKIIYDREGYTWENAANLLSAALGK
jgi:hypothetical protein